MRRFIIIQRTGFCPYFLSAWDAATQTDSWCALRDLAKRFTRYEAEQVVKTLNARNPGAPVPVTYEQEK